MLAPLAFVASAPVALERRVATVQALVGELAQKSGQELRMRPELRDEVLYVDLKPRPAEELMRLVARAASAEWFRDEGHTWLGRSPSFWRKQTDFDAKATARAFRERLAPLLAPGDATPWTDGTNPVARAAAYVDHLTPAAENDTSTHHARMRAMEPAGRLLSRVLRALPPAEIGALPVNWYTRYAAVPTGRQRALPGSRESVLQYVDERRTFTTEFDATASETRSKVSGNLMLFSLNVPTPNVPTVRLQIHRSPETIMATMTVYDPAHREIDQEFANVPALSLAEEAEVESLPGYAEWRSRKIPIGSVTRAFSVGSVRPPDPALSRLLLDPVVHEPLAVALADPMNALATAMGDDAIIALPDRAARLTWSFADGRDGLGEFANGLSTLCALHMENGTLVGPLRRPTDAAFSKTRRAVLRDLFRVAARGEPRLSDVVRYAATQNPESGRTGFEEAVWGGAGFGPRTPAGLFEGSRDPLRLLGDLSPTQRRSLLAGGSLTVGELPLAAHEDLERWLFARSLSLDWLDGVSNDREIADTISEIRPGMRLEGRPGLARSFVAYSGEDGRSEYTDAQFLGHVLWSEAAGNHPPGWPDVTKTRFRPGTWHDFALAFVAAPDIRGHADLIDTDLNPDARAVPYGELPVTHRTAMARGYGKALP